MTTTFYEHWRDVPEGAWRRPNFSPAEIACRGTGRLLVHEEALDRLQALRDRLGKPFIVRSAYRSPEHNRAVGGASPSATKAMTKRAAPKESASSWRLPPKPRGQQSAVVLAARRRRGGREPSSSLRRDVHSEKIGGLPRYRRARYRIAAQPMLVWLKGSDKKH